MSGSTWEGEKEKRRNEALENHDRLSKLFKEDRFSFERERREQIRALIDCVQNEKQRERLRELQYRWDKRLKGAGSPHNRWVLCQSFFWEHFHEVWNPAIQGFSRLLSDRSTD
jgi:hypothetical protein